LGSDYDGVGDTLPEGLEDPSRLPNLFAELHRRGYDEAALAGIAGENLLRVWSAVEAYAQTIRTPSTQTPSTRTPSTRTQSTGAAAPRGATIR
ncbi:MAG: membrane dipeptidase, partial [Myxococcota bacterium]